MGVWGTGFFENDQAQDLVGEVQAQGLRPLRQAIRAIVAVPKDEIIDEDYASRGVAAAALVGHAFGLKIVKLPDEIQEALEEGHLKCRGTDAKNASEAIERVLNHSYLEQAWSPTRRKVWRKQLSHLLSSLKSFTDKPAKDPGPKKKSPAPKSSAPKAMAGDVFLIPIAVDEYAVAKVLFAFRMQKHCVFLGISDSMMRSLAMPSSLSGKTVVRLYSTDDAIREGIWHKVGELPVPEEERQATLRLFADEVWLGDEMVRRASAKDKKILPQMDPGGSIATEYEIWVALGRCKPASVQARARIWHLRGLIHLMRNELQKAIIYFDLANQEDPQLAVAYWDRAKAWDHLGKPDKAESDRQKAIALDPSYSAKSE